MTKKGYDDCGGLKPITIPKKKEKATGTTKKKTVKKGKK